MDTVDTAQYQTVDPPRGQKFGTSSDGQVSSKYNDHHGTVVVNTLVLDGTSSISQSSEEFSDENVLDEFLTTIEGFQPTVEEITNKVAIIKKQIEAHGITWFTQQVRPSSPTLEEFWKFYSLPESLEFKELLSRIFEIAELDLASRSITFQEKDQKFFKGLKTIKLFDLIPYLSRSLHFF